VDDVYEKVMSKRRKNTGDVCKKPRQWHFMHDVYKKVTSNWHFMDDVYKKVMSKNTFLVDFACAQPRCHM